jgi:GNAT superfamily N-acetyltransferase
VVAWGWVFLPGTLEWQVHPEQPQLFDDVLDWFEAETEDTPRATTVRSTNEEAVERLQARGYRYDRDTPWMLMNVHSLEEIEEPRLPDGFRLRTMAEIGDLAARVAVHQAAWREMGTRVTMKTFGNVTKTWPYRPDLDLVVEAPDGRLVAFALAWYDENNQVGEFEPVGTDPAYRRKGLGRAVNLFGLHRLREVGAEQATVAFRGDLGYPIPRRLYESVGFAELSRNRRFVKP